MRRISVSALPLIARRLMLWGLPRQSLQARRHIQQRPPVVIRRLPDLSFRWILRLPVRSHHLVDAVKLGINLVLSDEPPLFLECVEVLGRFLAIFFMHQQKGIETFELHPPFFALVFGLSECCAVFVKAAHVGVPPIGQRMIH